MISLPGPDKVYALKPSLQLIADIESAHGSLYLLADDLLEKTLPLSGMVDVVKRLYRHAGCHAEIDEFLLQQPCADILINFLLDVLGPIEKVAAALAPDIIKHPLQPFLDAMIRKFPDAKEK